MRTTEPGCLTTSTSILPPFGVVIDSTTTEKTRPSKTFLIWCGTAGLSMSVLFAIAPAGERVQYVLQIRRQRRGKFHPPAVPRVFEGEPLGVEEWPLKMGDGADVARHPAMNATVQGVADNRVADGAQMHADLMCAAGVNRNLAQRQSRQVKGSRNASDRLT